MHPYIHAMLPCIALHLQAAHQVTAALNSGSRERQQLEPCNKAMACSWCVHGMYPHVHAMFPCISLLVQAVHQVPAALNSVSRQRQQLEPGKGAGRCTDTCPYPPAAAAAAATVG
jgi:hypothetical protein